MYLTRPPARIPESGESAIPGVDGAVLHVGDNVTDREMIAKFRHKRIALDTEGKSHSGLMRYYLNCVQLAARLEDGVDHVLVCDPRIETHRLVIRDVLAGADEITVHNSVHDIPIMYVNGLITLKDVDKVIDTLIWARLAEPDERKSHSLGVCAEHYLNMPHANPLRRICKTLKITESQWYRTTDIDTPAYLYMAASDAVLLLRLRNAVRKAAFKQLTKNVPVPRWAADEEQAMHLLNREQVTNRMHIKKQCQGWRVDQDFVEDYRKRESEVLAAIEKTITDHGIVPNDSHSLARWLESNGELPETYKRTPKTKQPSGAAQDLERVNHPLVVDFLHHKRYSKIDSYLEKALNARDGSGRIRFGTNMLAASTGRQSVSGDLPAQQIPEAARGVLLAEPGQKLVAIDWSQIEPVVVANVAKDHHAIEHYESGRKFYDVVAEGARVPYATAKTILLAGIYGEGITKLSEDLGVPVDHAKRIQNLIWAVLPGTRRLVDKPWKGGTLQQIAEKTGKMFTLSGRVVNIPSGPWGVSTHKGVNYFVQGSAYDLLAESEFEMAQRGLADALFLSLHDELVVDAEAAEEVRQIMQTPPARLCEMSGRTPLLRTSISVLGERWGK